MTGAINLLQDKRGIQDSRVRHTGFFLNHLYSKNGGTTDVPRDICGIRDISVPDTEV